jgi:hypothetical protein
VTGSFLSTERWERLQSFSNEFTCYSAALATWLAATDDDWATFVDPGLWLRIIEARDGLLGFAYFPPSLRTRLGLVRTGSDSAQDAIDGILAELARSGRVIVAGDGYRLPWHVAAGRRHVPHWFVVGLSSGSPEVADPFACRNELGVQECARRPLAPGSLGELLLALPGEDPVHRLREIYALGDEMIDDGGQRYRWFVRGEVADSREPDGLDGPAGLRRLATHFRDRGQDPGAYGQADDIWSIARHRAFMLRHAEARASTRGDDALASWARDHVAPLVKKWGHIAPLLMQASLTLSAGREASASVPDTLDALAELERSAALAFERDSSTI